MAGDSSRRKGGRPPRGPARDSGRGPGRSSRDGRKGGSAEPSREGGQRHRSQKGGGARSRSQRPAHRSEVPRGLEQLEGRNPVVEALLRQKRAVRKIYLDGRAKPDPKIQRLLSLASAAGVKVERVDRERLDRMAAGEVHNGVIAHAEPLPSFTVTQLLDGLFERGEAPFLVLADELSYEHNLGAILRSALGAGVHGVVVPTRRGKGLSPVVHRVSMGGAEAVPLIREGISSALKICKKYGLRVVGADMGGVSHWDVDWRVPTALVLGGESKGLSSTLRKRCDVIAGVPLQGGLESLNVSVTAAVMLFERARQLSLD